MIKRLRHKEKNFNKLELAILEDRNIVSYRPTVVKLSVTNGGGGNQGKDTKDRRSSRIYEH